MSTATVGMSSLASAAAPLFCLRHRKDDSVDIPPRQGFHELRREVLVVAQDVQLPAEFLFADAFQQARDLAPPGLAQESKGEDNSSGVLVHGCEYYHIAALLATANC